MNPRILILDRSLLAINMYRLLFEQLGFSFLVARDYKEAGFWIDRHVKVNLVIFNSNVFKKNLFDDTYNYLKNESYFKNLPKIFLCREDGSIWQERLKNLVKSHSLLKPFHPDELLNLVKRLVESKRNR